MKVKRSIILSATPLVLLILFTGRIIAQEKKDSTVAGDDFFNKMLDYSRPGKYHQILGNLVGEWNWKGRHYTGDANPDSNKVEIEFSGTAVRKPFANGRFFITESTSGKGQKLQSPIQNGKMVTVNARQIITEGYDNVKGRFIKTLIGNHIGSDMSYTEGEYDSIKNTIIYTRVDELVPGVKMKVIDHFIIHSRNHYTEEIYGERHGTLIKDTEIDYLRAQKKGK